jgi:hypothetical protein
MMNAASATRSEAEVASILEEFERRNGVFGLTVDGISLWRPLRFEICFALQNLGLRRPLVPVGEIMSSLFGAIRQLAVAPRGIDYLGATVTSALRMFDERGWHDIYFDPVIDQIGRGAKMLYADAGGFAKNARHAFRQPVFNDTSVVAVSAVLGRLFPAKDDTAFRRLSELIIRDLALPEFSPERVRRKYSVLKWRVRLYRLVLKRLRPRCLLVPNSGQFALFLAANSLGIPFVEMQHGIFSEKHPDNLPAEALNHDRRAIMLPDLLTVYGAYWMKLLERSALGKLNRIRTVGAPMIEANRALRERRFAADPDKPVLTLTSQGIAAESLADFVAAFLKLCAAPLQLNIRLHPGYEADANHYGARFSGDPRVVLWRGNSRPDTFEMIAMSDLHLSISSACHFEALGIGTPTAIIALPSHELVRDLAERGDAILIDSPQALADLVGRRGWGTVPPQTADHYFHRNHVASLRAVLDECASLRAGNIQ